MKHQVIHQLTAEKVVTVQQGCQVLGVSRSGFYAGRRRNRQPKTLCGTRVRLRSLFEATGQCYGSRRLRKELAEQGIEIGRHRVRGLMKELQLKPIWKPKFVHTTDSNHNLPVYDNVLDRQFEQSEVNRAWVSDITYIRTLSGLGHGTQHADRVGMHGLADCHCSAATTSGADRTFRPRQSVRQP
jgi:transposase InsO family protein